APSGHYARGSRGTGAELVPHVREREVGTVKFRVERDVLAEAVTWTARTLPTRPPAPVLAGVRLEAAADGTLTPSTFDYEVSARGGGRGRRARHGARVRPAARRVLPRAAGQAGRRRARRHPRQRHLRLLAVHSPDDARRGLPGAAGDARARRLGRRRRLRGG